LVIDIIAAGNGKLLWRGTGARRLSQRSGPQEITAEVNETVEKILVQFPPQAEYKLGASPQPVESLKVVRLEGWNSGVMGSGLRLGEDNGMMGLRK